MRLFTGKGDDGTTGLLYGGRVSKADPRIAANGAVDEAQAFIGFARSQAEAGSELDEVLVDVERDLYVLMAELATSVENRGKLTAGTSLVTKEMVERVESVVEDLGERFPMPTEFVIPGQDGVAAVLDVARTVARRAEREAIAIAEPSSQAVPYLNRLSTLLWVLARWQEHGNALPSKEAGR